LDGLDITSKYCSPTQLIIDVQYEARKGIVRSSGHYTRFSDILNMINQYEGTKDNDETQAVFILTEVVFWNADRDFAPEISVQKMTAVRSFASTHREISAIGGLTRNARTTSLGPCPRMFLAKILHAMLVFESLLFRIVGKYRCLISATGFKHHLSDKD